MIDETAAARMLKIGTELFPLDHPSLSAEWRRKFDQAQSRKSAGENMHSTFERLQREAAVALTGDILMRASHKAPMSALTIGMAEKDSGSPVSVAHGARMRSLSAQADEEADEEKKKEGVKAGAGKTRCPLCGK
jgi:hypothetical protein